MELRHLRYFVAIAEESSVSKAAVRLRIAQPALSRQLRDLEEELGVAMCERGPAGIRLTEAGEVFLSHARRVLDEAREAVEAVRGLASRVSEQLTIGFLALNHLNYLKPVVEKFKAAEPGVRLEFFQGMQAEQLAALRESRIDCAFVNVPAPLAGLRSEVILDIPLVVVLPEGHRLLERKTIRFRDLEEESYVTCKRESRPSFYDYVRGVLASGGLRPRLAREVGCALDDVAGLVKMGLGYSVLPLYPGSMRTHDLQWRPFARPEPHIAFALVWRENPAGPLATFLELARKEYRLAS